MASHGQTVAPDGSPPKSQLHCSMASTFTAALVSSGSSGSGSSRFPDSEETPTTKASWKLSALHKQTGVFVPHSLLHVCLCSAHQERNVKPGNDHSLDDEAPSSLPSVIWLFAKPPAADLFSAICKGQLTPNPVASGDRAPQVSVGLISVIYLSFQCY